MLRIASLLTLIFILGDFLHQLLVDTVFFLELNLELQALSRFILHEQFQTGTVLTLTE